jgi:hypothetical protein
VPISLVRVPEKAGRAYGRLSPKGELRILEGKEREKKGRKEEEK